MPYNRKIRVLIIEDDEDDYIIIADYIRSIEAATFQIDWCRDYNSALEHILTNTHDIYFLDYRLGGQTGLELLDHAKVSGCDNPVVLLTGKGNRSIDIEAMKKGATDYLIKSELNTDKLDWCIRYSLDRCASLKAVKQSETKYRNLFESSKEAERINIQAQKLAANERLIRILAHEIRNPLNNIQLSADHLKLPNEKEKALVSIIQRNSIRINQIITELLDSTRLADLVFEKHSVQDILDESLMNAMERSNLQKVSVHKTYGEHPIEIVADKPRLKIAFSNILINAIEAMEPLKGRLDLSVTDINGKVSISVKDNGRGIPKEHLSKLFEPFFTMKKNGMGLGLFSAYSIIQSHKGTVQVESETDQGTKFIINLLKAE